MSSSVLRVSILIAAACLAANAQSPFSFNPGSLQVTAEVGSNAAIVRVVQLRSTPTASFLASSNQGWLSVWPASGTINAGAFLDIAVTINPSGKQTGAYNGSITVTPQGGGIPAILNVTLTVSGLTLFTSPPSLTATTYPEGIDYMSLAVATSDGLTREVNWSLATSSGGDWLSVTNGTSVFTPATINLQANAADLDDGAYAGEIRLTSPALPGVLKVVAVTFDVRDNAPRLRVVPTAINFFSYGSLQSPPQPVQVFSNNDLPRPFSITPNQADDFIVTSSLAGHTPSAVKFEVDSTHFSPLPRTDSFVVSPADGASPVEVKVKTDLQPSLRRAIPQVADGGGFRTRITVVNSDNAAATISLKFYKADPATHTTVIWNPSFEGSLSVTNVTIPVGASWSVITSGTGSAITSGWGEVISNQKVGGNAVFQFAQPDGRSQEAAVPICDTLMQRLLLPFDNTNDFVTSFALINLHPTEAADVRVAFRDDSGKLIRIDRVSAIPAGGHLAIELPNLFPYLAGARGTMDLSALTGQISLLGLRFNPTGAFTSFEAQSFNRRETGRRTLPQIADGGAFRTSITLVNQDALTAYVKLKFHKSSGANSTTDWDLRFDNGATASSTFLIPPCSSITLRTTGQSSVVEQGWGEIFSSGYWVAGFAIFERAIPDRPEQEAAVPVNYAAPNRVLLPFDNTPGFTTSIALANINEHDTSTINLVFRNSAGEKITVGALNLPAKGHIAFELIQQFAILQGLSGTLELSTVAGETSAVGLRFTNTGAYTTFKATPLAQF